MRGTPIDLEERVRRINRQPLAPAGHHQAGQEQVRRTASYLEELPPTRQMDLVRHHHARRSKLIPLAVDHDENIVDQERLSVPL